MRTDSTLSCLPFRKSSHAPGRGLDREDPDDILVVLDFTSAKTWNVAQIECLAALTSDWSVKLWYFGDSIQLLNEFDALPLEIIPVQPDGSGGRSQFVTVTHRCVGRRNSDSVAEGYVWAHPRQWDVGEVYASETAADAALRCAAAAAFSAHIYVTDDELRSSSPWEMDTLVLRPDEAASVLSRLLRGRGSGYLVAPSTTVQEDHYFKFAVDDLVPSLSDWVTEVAARDRRILDHALSLNSRIAQVLLARDDLAEALATPLSLRQVDALDRVMLFCLAALDEAAHIVNHNLQPMLERQFAKWQHPKFKEHLSKTPALSELAALWTGDSRIEQVTSVMRELRNRVHGAGFNSMWALEDTDRGQHYDLSMGIDPDGVDMKWLARANTTSSPLDWGLRVVEDRLFIDAEALCEKVTQETIRALESTSHAAAQLDRPGTSADLAPAEEHELAWLRPGVPIGLDGQPITRRHSRVFATAFGLARQ